jgi:glycerophosphoryl diester phosphodiesterase
MSHTRRDIAAVALGLSAAALVGAGRAGAAPGPALTIAGGGSSGDLPAGSQGAYELAIRDGADFIAAAFAPSKDGTLMALPDRDLAAVTDIAARPEFAQRRQSRFGAGGERSGWFVEDFTLAELKTLNLGAPVDLRRGRNGGRGGASLLTFEDVVAIARAGSVRTARVVGVHATMRDPAYFAGLDLAIEPRLAAAIRVAGYNPAAAAMFVASADAESLKTIGALTRARRVFRIGLDPVAASAQPDSLAAIRTCAEAIAAPPVQLLDLSGGKIIPPGPLIAQAHAVGLRVQAWTFGPGVAFPPPPFRPGDARRLIGALFAGGVDAVAGDLAAPIVRARDAGEPHSGD